jgi:thiol:disulfide interchange protein DsbA
MRMQLFKFHVIALLGLFAMAAQASVTSPVNNAEFHTLERTQPVDSSAKVEVTEFFSYSCPHCNAFDPELGSWVKANSGRIVFKRVPVVIHEGDDLLVKLYYALEAMGKGDELHPKIFHAIHVEHWRPETEADIADFVASKGVDRAKFLSAFQSFAVQAKAQRAPQIAENFKISDVPHLAVDGRFETAPSDIQESVGDVPREVLYADTLKVMDWLIAKAANDRNGHPAMTGATSGATKK